MPNYTDNVNLRLITRPDEDNENFNTQTMLNDNWDKIDDAIGDLPGTLTEMGLSQYGSVADAVNKVYKGAGGWNVALIQESTTLQFPEYIDEDIHVLLFGAGGGAGGNYLTSNANVTAGGGGGHLEEFDATIDHTSAYTIVIGSAGANGVSSSSASSSVTDGETGGASTAFGHTANGGGGGQKIINSSSTGNGGSGGTGGGAGYYRSYSVAGKGGSGSYGGGGGGVYADSSSSGQEMANKSAGGAGGTYGGRGGDIKTTPTAGTKVSSLEMPLWMQLLTDIDTNYGLSGAVSSAVSGIFPHMSSSSYTGLNYMNGKAGGGYGGKGGIALQYADYGGGGGYFQDAEYSGGGGYGGIKGSYKSGMNGGGGFIGIAAAGGGGSYYNGNNAETIRKTNAQNGICVIFYRYKGGRPE